MTTWNSMGHLEAIAARRDAEDEAWQKHQAADRCPARDSDEWNPHPTTDDCRAFMAEADPDKAS